MAVTLAEAGLAVEVPLAFVAVTVYVYAVFDCSPVTVNGLEAPDAVNDPGLEVTVYEEIAAPPVDGAVNATLAAPLLNARLEGVFVAVGADIVAGAVEGVKEDDAELDVELPLALFATAVKG